MRALVVLIFLMPLSAAAEAVLYVTPQRGNYSVGERFEVRVMAESGEQPISAAEGELFFDPAALQVLNISIQDSILDSWSTAPEFSNNDGYIRFSGWTGTHYEGREGLLLTIAFDPKRQIETKLDIPGGALLSAGGDSNILESVRPGFYSIGLREIIGEAEPEILGTADAPQETTIEVDFDEVFVGERISIQGRTAPNEPLTLRLASSLGTSEHPLTSDTDGRYAFESDPIREEGVYRARVIVLDSSHGLPSEQITVSVRPNLVAAAGLVAHDYSFLGFGLLGILMLAVALGYILHRRGR